MVCGILFHRYSAASFFNGDSFLSKFFYIGSIAIFAIGFIWMYFKDKIEAKSENVIILVYTFLMILAGITAVRLIFILAPAIAIVSAYALIKIYEYAKKSKEEIVKMIFFMVFALFVWLTSGSAICRLVAGSRNMPCNIRTVYVRTRSL